MPNSLATRSRLGAVALAVSTLWTTGAAAAVIPHGGAWDVTSTIRQAQKSPARPVQPLSFLPADLHQYVFCDLHDKKDKKNQNAAKPKKDKKAHTGNPGTGTTPTPGPVADPTPIADPILPTAPDAGSGAVWTNVGTDPGPVMIVSPDYLVTGTLTPTAVPVPAAIWLLGSGLIALGLTGKVRRQG